MTAFGMRSASLALVSMLPAAAMAQGGSVGAVVIGVDHYLFTKPLIGVSGQLAHQISHTPLFVRVSAQRLTRKSYRVGSTCVGLVPPNGCPSEPLRDDAGFIAGTVGVGIRLLHRRHVALNVTGDVGVSVINLDTHGTVNGVSISARKELWDSEIGVEAAWSPWPLLPLGINAGVAIGAERPRRNEGQIDGYSPFEETFRVMQAHIGLAWRLPARRP